MTVTKDSLARALQNDLEISKAQAEKFTETLLELIKKSLESGEDVLISGFGKFCVKSKKPRKGRNPATGKELILDARRIVVFKCSPVMRKKIDKEFVRSRAKTRTHDRKQIARSRQKGGKK